MAGTIIINQSGPYFFWQHSLTNYFQQDLIIKSPAEVVIDINSFTGINPFTNVMYFSKNKHIIIEPGAKLTLNGVIVTGCEQYWGGIIIEGNANVKQDNVYHGELVMNQSYIINADTGISVGRPQGNNQPYGGGILKAENSGFYNNRYSIVFNGYFDPSAPYITENLSRVYRNKFIWDSLYSDSFFIFDYGMGQIDTIQRFREHISVYNTYGLYLIGNEFINKNHWHRWKSEIPVGTPTERISTIRNIERARGIGLSLYNASVVLHNDGPCQPNNHTYPDTVYEEPNSDCMVCIGKPNLFEGFHTAIQILASDVNTYIDILGVNFINCQFAIFAHDTTHSNGAERINNIYVNRCTMHNIGYQIWPDNYGYFKYFPGKRFNGISLYKANNFKILDNLLYNNINDEVLRDTFDNWHICPNNEKFHYLLRIDSCTHGQISQNSFINQLHKGGCPEYVACIKSGGMNAGVQISCNSFYSGDPSQKFDKFYDLYFSAEVNSSFYENQGNQADVWGFTDTIGSAVGSNNNNFSPCYIGNDGYTYVVNVGLSLSWSYNLPNNNSTDTLRFYYKSQLSKPQCYEFSFDTTFLTKYIQNYFTNYDNECDFHSHCNRFYAKADSNAIPAGMITFPNNNDIGVYPNPASNIIKVENVSIYSTIKIYDIYGRELRNFNQEKRGKSIIADIESLSTGIYLIYIPETHNTFKIIKQ